MATLFDTDKVKYQCSCTRFKALCFMYFCKHCVTLKCKECVLHENDTKHYCPSCFDNKTSKEASALKYKCLNCFNCPSCGDTLIIRASNANPQKKSFYMICGFCRWTTREVNIQDADKIPDGWKMRMNEHEEKINELCAEYRQIVVKDKQEKLEKKKKVTLSSKRKAYQSIVAQDLYGILKPYQKIIQPTSQQQEQSDKALEKVSLGDLVKKMAEKSTRVSTFDDENDHLNEDFDINTNTSIEQRLSNPDYQPDKCSKLYPLNKFFVTKESKRCNVCEHNVIKPENNIASIKFKLNQMALFLIPEIRVVSKPKWKLNEKNEIILSITNKCESEISLSLISSEKIRGQSCEILFKDNETLSIDRQDTKTLTPALKQTDNAEYLVYRRDNKIAIKCHLIPLRDDVSLKAKFQLKHSYYGMSVDLQAQPVLQHLTQTIEINFGLFKSSAIIPRPKYIDDCVSAPRV